MGWMNDILKYMALDPICRKYNHNLLTFSFHYAFSENFILPFSHDEVVHGKASLLNKMFGSYDEKFDALRLLYAFMMAHPGKKLNFMGSEFGQFKEWNYSEGVEFFLKEYPLHDKLSNMVKDLNKLYKSTPALYEIEDSWAGIEWLAPDDGDRNFIAFQRTDIKGESVIVLINFSGSDLHDYRLGLEKGKYQLIFNSDADRYGGGGTMRKTVFNTKKAYSHGKEYSITFDLPKLTCVYLKKII
jgi:1,4-alpha-glucan branching enzyme